MRHFSPIASIVGIDLCKVDIEMLFICPKVHLTQLVHPNLIFYLSQEYSNAPKSVLNVEKSAVG